MPALDAPLFLRTPTMAVVVLLNPAWRIEIELEAMITEMSAVT
jgi:hypothetical protein